MESPNFMLSTSDWVIIGLTLFVSASIGVYFQFKDKKKTNEEFLLASKSMSVLPVSISTMATFLSSITLMGLPPHMYLYGTHMAFMTVGYILGVIGAVYLILPVYYYNDVSTAYEYLDRRFGRGMRTIMSAMIAFQLLLYNSAVLYAPALALSAVTNLSVWTSIISIGAVCTFYSALGGMKAVMWADVFQAGLIFATLFSVVSVGCWILGGFEIIFAVANEGGRLVVPKVSFNTASHYTIFNVIAQGCILTFAAYGGNQAQVQRLLTLKSLEEIRMACFLSIPLTLIFYLMCCLSGLILYAYFVNCDPLSASNQPIHSPDQLLPYFITQTMSHLPGLPGLCFSGIFSCSLSTISSSVNALAAVTVQDFIQPAFPRFNTTVTHSKIISLFFGVLTIILAFMIASMGSIMKITMTILGVCTGPSLGVFFLGTCTKAANQKGVYVGIVASFALSACLLVIPNNRKEPFLPLSNECPSIDGEYSSSFTHLNSSRFNSSTIPSLDRDEGNTTEEESFQFAYMWLSSYSLLACVFFGYIASVVFDKFQDSSVEVPEKYLSPPRIWFSKLHSWNSRGWYKREEVENPEHDHERIQLNNTSCS